MNSVATGIAQSSPTPSVRPRPAGAAIQSLALVSAAMAYPSTIKLGPPCSRSRHTEDLRGKEQCRVGGGHPDAGAARHTGLGPTRQTPDPMLDPTRCQSAKRQEG